MDNVKKLVKMIRKQSKIPIGVGFGIKTFNDVKRVSKLADLTVCGSSIVNKIREGHQNGLSKKNLGKFVGDYVKILSQGVKS
jgi:tryptophan synthase alpha chain